MTRKALLRSLTLAAVSAVGMISLPATANADSHRSHSDVKVDINIGNRPRYEERTDRIWVEPVYRTVCDRVWVGPTYRTECDRVWIAPVTSDKCEQVWVPERWEMRDVIHYDHGTSFHRKERVLVERGHYTERHNAVVIREGHWETRDRQVLVCDGHWENVDRQEMVTPGHWEYRTERVATEDCGPLNWFDIFARVGK